MSIALGSSSLSSPPSLSTLRAAPHRALLPLSTAPDRLPRPLRYALGVASLMVGAALLVLPGPGLPFILGGMFLLEPAYPPLRRLRRGLIARGRRAKRSLHRRLKARRRRGSASA
jgi:hypothetical protein